MVGDSANRQFCLRLIGYILCVVYRSYSSFLAGSGINGYECYHLSSAISVAGF
jgi:hypothetical protein